MNLDLFDYALPESLIANRPASPRDSSRLLIAQKKTAAIRHQRFSDIEQILVPGDVLVLNRTKVLKARVFGQSAEGRRFEVFLLNDATSSSRREWLCLARPGKKIREPLRLDFPGDVAGTIQRHSGEFFRIQFHDLSACEFSAWLDNHGEIPLPPYIRRQSAHEDSESYQTVYAAEAGSVAAPTAGLHFTDDLLNRLRTKGVQIETITLHVGYGTFSPIKVERLEDHQMHYESFLVTEACAAALTRAKQENRRIIAVGTTSLRALESPFQPGMWGSTNLFITPGFPFKWADGLITNFHLPKSSLLVLVSAFFGLEKTRACYDEAIKNGYRFFSYGDAMAILP